MQLAQQQLFGLAVSYPAFGAALRLTADLSCLQAAALGSDIENPYLRITRIVVWVAIGLAVVSLLHIVLLLLFVTRRWTLPDMLYFPRPQLFVMALAVPATAEGAASESQAAALVRPMQSLFQNCCLAACCRVPRFPTDEVA